MCLPGLLQLGVVRSRYCTIEATDGHEASRGLFAAAELHVLVVTLR